MVGDENEARVGRRFFEGLQQGVGGRGLHGLGRVDNDESTLTSIAVVCRLAHYLADGVNRNGGRGPGGVWFDDDNVGVAIGGNGSAGATGATGFAGFAVGGLCKTKCYQSFACSTRAFEEIGVMKRIGAYCRPESLSYLVVAEDIFHVPGLPFFGRHLFWRVLVCLGGVNCEFGGGAICGNASLAVSPGLFSSLVTTSFGDFGESSHAIITF